MANDSPFLLFRVECPLCKTINEFESIRVGAYAEESRDTDFCPVNVKWRFPRYQGHNPLVYFIATCGHCKYSREFTNEFKEWKNDNYFRTYRLKTVKNKHLDQLATADSIVKLLGDHIDLTRYPNESAILKLHLAIYDEQLAEHFSNLDVGRFYLRIAWVFRDLERNENPNIATLNGLVHEVEGEFSRLKTSLENSSSQLEAFQRRVQAHFASEQLSAEWQSQMLAYRERYDQAIQQMQADLAGAHNHAEGVTSLLDEYRRSLLGGDSDSSVPTFGQHGSFLEYLQHARHIWSGVVTNEREALEKAVRHYKEAFANGRDIAPGNQQIQASYLIAELSRRIGDFDEAKQYFTSTIKSGQEFIYQNRNDQSRTALAKKILELAIEQGRANLAASRPAGA